MIKEWSQLFLDLSVSGYLVTMSQELMTRMGSAMHHDFCPWANQYVYWLKRPIGWVVLAFAASLLLGIYVSYQAYMAAGIIAAVGIIGAMWPWISMMGIRGDLSWSPSRCEEGEVIDTTLTITNRWPWPAWGLVVQADDAISRQVNAPEQPISLSKVPGWTRSRFRWDCRPASRGIYPKHSVRLTSAFPFGIWSCSRTLQVSDPLVVWPRIVRLTDVPENTGTQRLGIGGVSQRVGDDGDWMGVRPYREGDSLRQVHWAQTARRDNLVVFERQSRSQQSVSIALDVAAASICSMEERDWMLRIVGSLANHFLHHAWSLRVHLGDRWHALHGGNRNSFMDQLAAWEPYASGETPILSFDSDPGLAIAVTTSSFGVSSKHYSRRVWVLKTSSCPGERVEGASESGSAERDIANQWSIAIDEATEEHLREVWRRVCHIGVAQEVGAGR